MAVRTVTEGRRWAQPQVAQGHSPRTAGHRPPGAIREGLPVTSHGRADLTEGGVGQSHAPEGDTLPRSIRELSTRNNGSFRASRGVPRAGNRRCCNHVGPGPRGNPGTIPAARPPALQAVRGPRLPCSDVGLFPIEECQPSHDGLSLHVPARLPPDRDLAVMLGVPPGGPLPLAGVMFAWRGPGTPQPNTVRGPRPGSGRGADTDGRPRRTGGGCGRVTSRAHPWRLWRLHPRTHHGRAAPSSSKSAGNTERICQRAAKLGVVPDELSSAQAPAPPSTSFRPVGCPTSAGSGGPSSSAAMYSPADHSGCPFRKLPATFRASGRQPHRSAMALQLVICRPLRRKEGPGAA